MRRVCPASAIQDGTESTCTLLKGEDWPQSDVNNTLCVSCIACIQACPVGCLGLGQADPSSRYRTDA